MSQLRPAAAARSALPLAVGFCQPCSGFDPPRISFAPFFRTEPTATKNDEISLLEDILGKLTTYHPNKPKGGVQLPKIEMPNLGIKAESVGTDRKQKKHERLPFLITTMLPARRAPLDRRFSSVPPPFTKPNAKRQTPQVNEMLRKGAEDTQNMIASAGQAMGNAFHAAAEMHKKYAPKPSEKPMEVNASLRDK